MFILKTVDYLSKLLDFQNEQAPDWPSGRALFLKFYYYAQEKTGCFLRDTR